MRVRDYFPLGLAFGKAFCNRAEETNLLINNIKNTKHTLLIATRRYGKSSLALHALKKSRLPYTEVDFFMVSNEKMIESYILNGVADLMAKALGPVEKLLHSIKKYLKTLKPKINIGGEHFKLELSSEHESDPATSVKEALLLLDKMLAEKKKYAVFLMDEFQMVGSIAQGKGIEAAIRHVAQKTEHLMLLFSGSNRKLLKTMFEDENRPLYKLCWKLSLERISVEHYKKHLQGAAKAFWKSSISNEALMAIINLSERHPYYINKLCDLLWTSYADKPPELVDVNKVWKQILEEEKSDVVKEISLLSPGQKIVLSQLAKHPEVPLTGKQSMLSIQVTSSSIMAALEGLDEKDVIERIDHQYQIINPVLKHYVLVAGQAV